MKRLTLLCCAALTFAACNNASKTEETPATTKDTTTASADKPAPPMPMPDSATAQKNWEAYMTPGDPHKMMASWNGTWNGDVTLWYTPDSPPSTSKSTAVNKMIMGGRYQQSLHSGDMMGMPFEGQSLLAYDNAKKQFVSTWIDNTGTGIMVLSGPWDEASKSMTLTGKMVSPTAGDGREQNIREVFKIVDDNNQVMEMYCSDPGSKEYKTMEIKYSRKK